MGIQYFKNSSAYSYHASLPLIEFTVVIPSINQSDILSGYLGNALESSLKKLWCGAFWDCLRVLSGNDRQVEWLSRGVIKLPLVFLLFQKSIPNACRSSLRMSICFGVLFFFLGPVSMLCRLIGSKMLIFFHLFVFFFYQKKVV